jgi:hypothetical protein
MKIATAFALALLGCFVQISMCAGAARTLFLVATLSYSRNLVHGAGEVQFKAAQAIFDDAGFSGYVR